MQDDFVFSVKKSIIDFALHDYKSSNHCDRAILRTSESLDEIKVKRWHFESMALRVQKNLFKIHPTIVKISQLWFLQYR